MWNYEETHLEPTEHIRYHIGVGCGSIFKPKITFCSKLTKSVTPLGVSPLKIEVTPPPHTPGTFGYPYVSVSEWLTRHPHTEYVSYTPPGRFSEVPRVFCHIYLRSPLFFLSQIARVVLHDSFPESLRLTSWNGFDRDLGGNSECLVTS